MNGTSESEINQEKQNYKLPATGHVKNAVNFQLLISFCSSLGAIYNPSNPRLAIHELEVLSVLAFEKLERVHLLKVSFNLQTANRRSAFEDLKPFATKIINAFAASGVDKAILDHAKQVNKMLQGVVLKNNPAAISEEVHTSQQSYDHKINHFEALINILEETPQYRPNEEELKLVSLKTKLNYLQQHNNNLANSYRLYSNALHERNQILYHTENGLIPAVKEVKQYVKSVFGANSFEYHQIGALQFKVRTGE